MEDYEMITRLGGGSFADVYKAREISTGEIVAIKILKRKYKKWEECIELRECKSLQRLNKASYNEKGKDNIIKLKRIIFINKTGVLNLVFEFMEKDLLILMKSFEPKWLPENKIKDIVYQTLLGLSYMHKYGFFHRDLKPENLLLVGDNVKIADFGLAREIRSIPPYTEYVSTRYYRAPECILKSTNYNSPIDIWALGCVMAEMYLHPRPLFYGANEKEVLFRICSILGTPTYDMWPDGIQQANFIGFKFPNNNKVDLAKIIPNASEDAIDLMNQMIKWDPNRRATASNLLKHKFFENYKNYSGKKPNDSINYNIDFNFDNCKVFSNDNKQSIKKKDNIIDNITNSNKSINDNIKVSNNYGLGESFLIQNNNNNEKKKDENNFSKMLNDTDGFNKLLNQLKQEKIEEDKDYEKRKKDNNFNNLFMSIEKKLDINSSEMENNKDSENSNDVDDIKIEKKIEKKVDSKNIINHNKTKKFSLFEDFTFNDTKDSSNVLDKDNNMNNNLSNNSQATNIFNNDKIVNKDYNLNTLDILNNKLENKDNNDEFFFNLDKAERLKPIVKNNRRGSARKFLEENENKMVKLPKINVNNERKLKYNLSNNLLGDFGKKDHTKPTLIRNEFSFVGNLNGIFDNKPKNNYQINNYNYNGYNKKRESNYGKNIALTNNNIPSPYYMNNNMKNENIFDNKNLRREPKFNMKGNIWDL